MNCEEQSQRGYSFFTTGKIGHWLKTFSGGYAVVINTIQVRFFRIFGTKECLCGLILR